MRRQETIARVPAGLTMRSITPEAMDDPALDAARHHRALDALARLNRLAMSARTTWPHVRALAQSAGRSPVRLLDVATGAGDAPLAFARFALRDSLSLDIAACDKSETALAHARRRAQSAGAGIRFSRLDALRDPIPDDCDILTCSLFLHHLADEQIVRLLRSMAESARVGFVVSDLRRTRPGLVLAALASRTLTRSPVVRIDALRSVRAALTLRDARALAERAGLIVRLVRQFPQRFLMTWRRRPA